MTGFLISGSLADTRSSNLQLNLCSIMALSFKPRIFLTILDFIPTPQKIPTSPSLIRITQHCWTIQQVKQQYLIEIKNRKISN